MKTSNKYRITPGPHGWAVKLTGSKEFVSYGMTKDSARDLCASLNRIGGAK